MSMIFLYYLGFALLLAVAGPAILTFKKKARCGVGQKLGMVPSTIKPKGQQRRVWFHTVSVGEFNAAFPLIQLFKSEHRDCEIFVSTTTGTGQALAKSKVGDWATVFYFPYDLPFATGAWLDRVQPDMVAIVETEIWPGFIYECSRRGISVCCVNGRISPRSFKRHQRAPWFIRKAIGSFSAIAAQTEQEAARYLALGAHAEAVTICGNMKFDGMKAAGVAEKQSLQEALNLHTDDLVIVGGSTHESEESALLEALTEVVTSSRRRVRLIIAPRHPERFERVFQIVENYGFRVRCFSRGEAFEKDNDVYVLDTIGQLMNFYSLATVAFVGGTLAPIGGHNIVEPYIYRVPVVCGPHIEKTRDVAYALLERDGLVKVQSADQLVHALLDLITSSKRRQTIGNAGREFLDESQGAVKRTMAVLNREFAPPSINTPGTPSDIERPLAAASSGRGEAMAP